MLFAAIDIGTNAVRLYFANVFLPKGLPIVEKASLIRLPLRLGEDVFKSGVISEERTSNLIKTLKAFKYLIEVYNPLDYTACATSAMREAENNTEIIKSISDETGINVKIIDGIEEARIVCAANNITTSKNKELLMYVDVGGGSTEVSILRNHQIVATNSFQIGTIRILSGADSTDEWRRFMSWLMNFEDMFGNICLIGSGGNINKLCKLYGKSEINTLRLFEMEKGYKILKKMTLKQRIEEMGLRPDRADVIVPAIEIFFLIMNTIKCESIYVPRIGLTDGLIYNVYFNYIQKAQRSDLSKTVASVKL